MFVNEHFCQTYIQLSPVEILDILLAIIIGYKDSKNVNISGVTVHFDT